MSHSGPTTSESDSDTDDTDSNTDSDADSDTDSHAGIVIENPVMYFITYLLVSLLLGWAEVVELICPV
jgi:hypothetical protein